MQFRSIGKAHIFLLNEKVFSFKTFITATLPDRLLRMVTDHQKRI